MIKNQRGQAVTEFLVVVILLISIIVIHAQFSLNYVVASFFRYASFMGARTEAVNPGKGQVYIQEFAGTPDASKLRPIASVLTPESPDYVIDHTLNIHYQTLQYLPFTEKALEHLTTHSAISPITREPINDQKGIFDNE